MLVFFKEFDSGIDHRLLSKDRKLIRAECILEAFQEGVSANVRGYVRMDLLDRVIVLRGLRSCRITSAMPR